MKREKRHGDEEAEGERKRGGERDMKRKIEREGGGRWREGREEKEREKVSQTDK